MIYYFFRIFLVAFVFMSIGCASSKKSVGFGATMGAIAGGLADPGKDGEYRTRNVVVGSAFGAVTGSILFEENKKIVEIAKKSSLSKEQNSQAPQTYGVVPSLTHPKVRTEWIEGHVVNNRYIEGHFEYIIEEPVRWNR